MNTAKKLTRWLIYLLPTTYALFLYLPTLGLPLIYDTLLHIRIAGNLDWRAVWLPNDAFGFYRPLTFAPMLLIEQLFGYYPHQLLHGLNIFHHSLNTFLLITLAQRLWHHPLRAAAAGTLFATAPFSYQAIAVYGHNVHPFTTTLILLGLLTFLRTPTSPRWHLPTATLFALAILSHESAILFGGFAALCYWQIHPNAFDQQITALRHPRHQWRQLFASWQLYIIAGFAYLFIYQFLPISRAPQAAVGDPGPLLPRLLYLLQSLTHPLTYILNQIPPLTTRLSATTLILTTTFILLLALLNRQTPPTATTRQRLGHRLHPFLPTQPAALGLLWWAAASLLIAIPLTTEYLLHGPRLLYLGTVGVALTWGYLLFPTTTTSMNKFTLLITTTLGLLFLLNNHRFVHQRLTLYQQLTTTITTPLQQMAPFPSDHQTVIINLPDWLDDTRNHYPIGSDFVAMLGDYLFIDEIVAANTRSPHDSWTAIVPEIQSPTNYNYGLHQQTSFDPLPPLTTTPRHYFLTHTTPDAPQTAYTGWASTAPPPNTTLAHFTHYTLSQAAATYCHNQLTIDLTWHPIAPIPPTITLFVQLFDQTTQLTPPADGPPLGLPPYYLPTATTLADHRLITTTTPPTHLLIGAYDYTTG
ncbi:MAG TPA: hypothetical protein VLL52_22015, partial [Anaerolineae bacterium]|nr:hypothetical protein [Anaerolineae bacterium]